MGTDGCSLRVSIVNGREFYVESVRRFRVGIVFVELCKRSQSVLGPRECLPIVFRRFPKFKYTRMSLVLCPISILG